jgi:hypothetical protein
MCENRLDTQEQDTGQTLRNRIQVRHSGTGYRSDIQEQIQVRLLEQDMYQKL